MMPNVTTFIANPVGWHCRKRLDMHANIVYVESFCQYRRDNFRNIQVGSGGSSVIVYRVGVDRGSRSCEDLK
jgi:hypothetical protein